MSVPFKKVLIANRGEIAVRVARTCRKMGIETVAIYSEADRDALHVSEADSAYAVGPARVQDSYLNLDAITEVVKQSGADAVHPGYGLLSEDPRLSQAVSETGAAFIGPAPAQLRALGDKLEARQLALRAGVEVPPGTPDALSVSEEEAVSQAARAIGFPLLVKAAAGGGGIGMTPVRSEEQLLGAVQTCSKRAEAAFGDGRVYMERLIEAPRHVEVQVAADAHGTVVTFGERECSVQRRHQKVVEEAPCPGAFCDAALREKLYTSARQLIEAARFEGQPYVGLATVEFIIDAACFPAQVYFLEVNARLQVEHPVTERVFGLDLVELQLTLAGGGSLSSAEGPDHPDGHAIEARVYAEDPAKKFIPQPGTLEQLVWPEPRDWLRVDTGYRQGDVVTPYYDPLIAKLTAHGQTREQAIVRLRQAISETQLKLVGPKGPKASNLPFLHELLGSVAWVSGEYTTHLIEEFQASSAD